MRTNRTNVLKKLIILAVLGQLFVGCKDANKNSNDSDLVTITATDKMSADELVTSAEQLLGPHTFMLAYKLTKMAADKNPENIKAQFYMRLLSRFEVFRGIYTRIKPMLNKEQTDRLAAELNKLPNSPLKSFLTEPGIDIKTTQDIQDVVSQYLDTVSNFYQFLKDREDTSFEIYLNPIIFEQEIRSELSKNCTLVEDSKNKLTVECDRSEVATKKVNIADMIALRQLTAGELIYGAFANSYSLDGIENVLKADRKMNNQQVTEMLLSNSKFGLLNKKSLLPKLTKIGADLSAALTWATQYQSTICPEKSENKIDKRPNYIFKDGLCIYHEDEVSQLMSLLNTALKGSPISIDFLPAKSISVDAFAWSRNPVADLRQIQPSEYDENGDIKSLKDNTLGGIFINNDADRLFNK